MNEKSNTSLFCWEQVLKTNRAFRVSRIFAPADAAPGLLPLYALFSSVEQICSDIQDEELAIRKLNWWRKESQRSDVHLSDHPIFREMHRVGAASRLRPECIGSLLDVAQSRLDSPAPADMAELKSICIAVSQPQLDLETGISGTIEIGQSLDPDFTACGGLLQLIRESAGIQKQGGYWWIPLNLLARHGLTRARVEQASDSEAAQTLFREILDTAKSWGEQIQVSGREEPIEAPPLRHLLVIHNLYRRKLACLERLKPELFAAELGKLRLGDVVSTWKMARRINRQ